jgi:23S rRNA (cytidine1920-2'-O)/16S rRNA (cytidine1409-2'-O)-methyltransferase
MERALEYWKLDVSGKNCLDVGASTGGFTDCLLQHSAAHVTAVDTGYGQIAMKLRQDVRVRLVEKCNARLLTAEALGELVDLVVMDVSFISATLVLPPVVASAFPAERSGRFVIVLVKPQFEVGRGGVGKGGIVRDEAAQLAAIERVRGCAVGLGAQRTDVVDSPILGAEGNREFLLYMRF